MDGRIYGGEDEIDWNTDDELEIASYNASSSLTLSLPGEEGTARFGEAICPAGPSSSSSNSNSIVDDFLTMGFPEKLIVKAIKETRNADADLILNTLLTLRELEDSPEEQEPLDSDLPEKQQTVDSNHCSSDYGKPLDEDSDIYSYSEDEDYEDFSPETANTQKIKEEITDSSYGTNSKLSHLVGMGYDWRRLQ